jgi:hypothetical protein
MNQSRNIEIDNETSKRECRRRAPGWQNVGKEFDNLIVLR